MTKTFGPLSFNKYSFRTDFGRNKSWGIIYAVEDFPTHSKTVHDLTFNYGKGSFYIELRTKIK